MDIQTIVTNQQIAEESRTGIMYFAELRGQYASTNASQNNLLLLKNLSSNTQWLRQQLVTVFSGFKDYALPPNYKTFQVHYFKRLKFISRQRGSYETCMMLKVGKFYR